MTKNNQAYLEEYQERIAILIENGYNEHTAKVKAKNETWERAKKDGFNPMKLELYEFREKI